MSICSVINWRTRCMSLIVFAAQLGSLRHRSRRSGWAGVSATGCAHIGPEQRRQARYQEAMVAADAEFQVTFDVENDLRDEALVANEAEAIIDSIALGIVVTEYFYVRNVVSGKISLGLFAE